MDDFLADFSKSSVVIKVPAGPKIDPPFFDNDIITDIKLSQAMDIMSEEILSGPWKQILSGPWKQISRRRLLNYDLV